jgi:hypothetical protein
MDKNIKQSEELLLSPEGEWRQDWPAAWHQIPPLLELTIFSTKGEDKQSLTFSLPNSNFFVVYE